MRNSELIGHPALRLTLAVSGPTDPEIQWVHAIDLYPASEFVSGPGIALTSGQWAGRASADEFVSDLVDAGIVALGFGITSETTDLPRRLITACERRDLTFFLVPVEVPFVQVIEVFSAEERHRSERFLRQQLEFQARFAAHLRTDRSLTTMLRALGEELGSAVALEADRRLYGAEDISAMHRFPLVSEGVTDASLYLDVCPDLLSLESRAALAIGTPFIALEIERIRSVRAATDEYARELFSWLRAETQDQVAIEARLASLGIKADSQLAILAVGSDEPDEAFASIRRQLGAGAVSARVDNTILVCAEAEPEGRLHGIVSALPPGTRAGAGSTGSPARLRLSLIQAEHALSLAMRSPDLRFVGPELLNSPSSIVRSTPTELVKETSFALLKPLYEYDETRGGQLIQTLETLLRCGGRLSFAANELYVHPNTLRHRIQLIEELTSRSLDQTRDRTDFDLAISIVTDSESSSRK